MAARIVAAVAALAVLLIAAPAAGTETESVEERRFVNAHFGTCLEASSFQETVEGAPCSAEAGDYQIWYAIQSEQGGPMQIINKATGYCLEGYLPTVLQLPCYGSSNPPQQWKPVPGDGGAVAYENLGYPGRLSQGNPNWFTIGLSTAPLGPEGLWVK